MDVVRGDGSAFECGTVLEAASGITRQIEPGLVLDVRCHPNEPKASADWPATATRLGRHLTRRDSVVRWPDPDEWPARGAVVVRLRGADERRLAARRVEWGRDTAVLADVAPGQKPFDQGRRQYTLTIDLGGRRLALLEAVPDLAFARLMEIRVEPDRRVLGPRRGAPVAALVDPTDAMSVCIDWEATLQFPEFRNLDGYDAM
jgi:hypothetical protein